MFIKDLKNLFYRNQKIIEVLRENTYKICAFMSLGHLYTNRILFFDLGNLKINNQLYELVNISIPKLVDKLKFFKLLVIHILYPPNFVSC